MYKAFYYSIWLAIFINILLFYSTVGVRSYLSCSKCDAHIGLLTDDESTGQLQYYANGLAMTFSPKSKQKFIFEELSHLKGPSFTKLTMDQMFGVVEGFHADA